MASLDKFNKLYETYSDLADFTTIYTQEAHPVEAEDFKNFVDIKIHKTMGERLKAAKEIDRLFGELHGKLFADQLDDAACKAYGSLPDRLYVVHKGKIVYQGGIGPFEYKVDEVAVWLESYKLKLE